jgi:hypothetical protein
MPGRHQTAKQNHAMSQDTPTLCATAPTNWGLSGQRVGAIKMILNLWRSPLPTALGRRAKPQVLVRPTHPHPAI